jgi:hypothetical protein
MTESAADKEKRERIIRSLKRKIESAKKDKWNKWAK